MIELRGITKSFGSLQVLKGIDLDIGHKEIVSIVGPSGAGKTTLLQIMGTLDKPDNGTLHIDRVDLEHRTKTNSHASATFTSGSCSNSTNCCQSLRHSRTS